MPQPSSRTAGQTSTSPAQSRVTVQLPKDTADALDRIGKLMSDDVFKHAKVRIDIARPDVVRSLAQTYESIRAEADAESAGADSPASGE